MATSREQAESDAERMNREHPARDTCHWVARPGSDGGWFVVKVSGLPGGVGALTATTEAKQETHQADPRPGNWQRVPPLG